MDTSQELSAIEVDGEKKGYVSGPEATLVSSVESEPLQQHHLHKQENELDSAALFSKGVTVTPEQSKAIRWKIDCHLMPLMCAIYLIQFMGRSQRVLSSITLRWPRIAANFAIDTIFRQDDFGKQRPARSQAR